MKSESSAKDSPETGSAVFSANTNNAVVRYQVQDVDRSITFYTERLGFQLVQKAGPVGIISRGDLYLLLSGAEASGSRKMPDGRSQDSGGWNRIVLYVESIDDSINTLKRTDTTFRNELEVGPGGKQILIDDPDGNPIELHEAP
jgi:catechol 2,3-dioxygenase-like lactoylglutathione lyase family enzyme